MEVTSHGEANGCEVPCLIVAAKDDLNPFPTEIQDSTRVCILITTICFIDPELHKFGGSIVIVVIILAWIVLDSWELGIKYILTLSPIIIGYIPVRHWFCLGWV